MAAIATFAPHDPDSSIADNTNTIGEESRSLLQSSYILHSYQPLRQERISPLRRSNNSNNKEERQPDEP